MKYQINVKIVLDLHDKDRLENYPLRVMDAIRAGLRFDPPLAALVCESQPFDCHLIGERYEDWKVEKEAKT